MLWRKNWKLWLSIPDLPLFIWTLGWSTIETLFGLRESVRNLTLRWNRNLQEIQRAFDILTRMKGTFLPLNLIVSLANQVTRLVSTMVRKNQDLDDAQGNFIWSGISFSNSQGIGFFLPRECLSNTIFGWLYVCHHWGWFVVLLKWLAISRALSPSFTYLEGAVSAISNAER